MNRHSEGIQLRGYTLIELLAVMAIIAIIMLIAMAGYDALTAGGKFDRAVSDLHCGISLGRQYAITKNEPVLVVFVEPTSFAVLNNGAVPERCGWGVLGAQSRQWVKAFVDLDGAVFSAASLWPNARNVVGLSDGGDSWFLVYTNIPRPWVSGPNTNVVVNLPGFAFKSDGMLHLAHGGSVDGCQKPKGVLLAPGKYAGGAAGWTTTVQGTRRMAVTANMIGGTFLDKIAD